MTLIAFLIRSLDDVVFSPTQYATFHSDIVDSSRIEISTWNSSLPAQEGMSAGIVDSVCLYASWQGHIPPLITYDDNPSVR
jgi:hypothetical protein